MKLKVSFVLTSAAALDEDLGLEVDVGAALNIVAYVVAVFLRREPQKPASFNLEAVKEKIDEMMKSREGQ
jgi:hypothetical protein